MRRVLAVATMAIGTLASSCFTVTNELFCCSTEASCADRGVTSIKGCDPRSKLNVCDDQGVIGGVSNTCVEDPISSPCDEVLMCATPARPVCDDDTDSCVRCTASAECAAFPAEPLCSPTSGECVECLTASDCADPDRPVCGSSSACRACVAHDECASGACDKVTGACVAEAELVFVDPTGGGTACTRAAPCATIAAGVAATSITRRFVQVSPASYSERVAVVGRSFTLLGAGADLSAMTIGPLFDIQAASTVTIEGLRIHDGAGSMAATLGDGVRCSDNNGPSTVTLRDVRLENNSGRGVVATNCTVTVAGGRVSGNVVGGVQVTGGNATIRNNFIARNGGPNSTIGGVDLVTPAMLVFEFNTVVDNMTTTGFAAGVQCRSGIARTLANNIVVGQVSDQVSATNCTFAYTLSNEVIGGATNSTTAPGFVDGPSGDFHLVPGSAGIDAADPAATLAVDIDGQPRPVPGAGRADIGADEVQ